MAPIRSLVPVLVGSLVALPVAAQAQGTITGRVIDATTQLPLAEVNVLIVGTQRAATSGADGTFTLSAVPAGTLLLRAIRIGYGPQEQEVASTAGAMTTVQFALEPQAALLEAVVVTGYGTQRREAVTASVSTIDAGSANVGIVPNVNHMLQGRAAGVNITFNSGEPGAGAQIRIRGATSISASNEPLYVIDGVPITNVETEATGIGINGSPPLPRSPLNLINPSDIGSITILKDAAATAIYGSRGANGVVLIETKKGGTGVASVEYDSYVATASPARRLGLLTGAEYRTWVEDQVAQGNLPGSSLGILDTANTDWEDAVTRTAVTHNHNLSFAGGTEATRYRASLNYMNEQGVALSNGFERVQGRLSATHQAWNSRLRLGLNVMTARVNNDYLPFENTGGFEGGVFVNMAIYNPTAPVRLTDATGTRYYELGSGALSIRNPVALAEQIEDFGNSGRTLGNATAALDLAPGLTASINVGVDQSEGIRRTYFPKASPVGAQWQGRARQVTRENSSVTFQGQLTFRREFAGEHDLDVVGVYEFAEHATQEFGAEAQNFVTDRFSFNSLNSGSQLVRPYSFRTDERWISFISRANYGYRDRYYLTGVLRYDGRSAFAEGHKWAAFPGLSASWRISEEPFFNSGLFTDLRLRAGWGVVGNPGVPPYSSLITLEATGGARYVFGETSIVGFAPVRNPNSDLKFEKTVQTSVAVDYTLLNNRVSGSLEYYVKNTSDLLLEVDVPQPAPASRRLENVGRVRNRGVELSLDVLAMSRPDLVWRAGLVFAAERNKVVDLGPYDLINTGSVSGEGQSGQVSQRILPGEPLGTFWGPQFVGVDGQGRELFACEILGVPSDTLCVNGQILGTQARAGDSRVIGNAYPDFTIGVTSQATWRNFDFNILIRGVFGHEVFNNTALVYGTKSKVLQGRNFLESALDDPTAIGQPAIYSSKWIESGTYVRLENVTVGYTLNLPRFSGAGRSARLYVASDNLLLLTGYDGLDPEGHTEAGLASRGVDYLHYPRPRTFTAGLRVAF